MMVWQVLVRLQKQLENFTLNQEASYYIWSSSTYFMARRNCDRVLAIDSIHRE